MWRGSCSVHAIVVVDIGVAHSDGAKRDRERRAYKRCLQVVSQQQQEPAREMTKTTVVLWGGYKYTSANLSIVWMEVVVVVLAVGTAVHLTDDLLVSPAAATPSPPPPATITATPRPIIIPLHDALPGPAEYNVEGVIYLTPEDQEKLPYRIVSLLPWNHFGRKNIGYLYAVHHGATVCMYHIPHV